MKPFVFADTILSGDALEIGTSDLALKIVRGDGDIVEEQHSRGGNWLRDDGVRECTSGWSVSRPNGDGIVTAAHCTGLNEFEQPGITPYGMTFRDQERGSGGDVEYHTTTHVEYAEFYSNATTIRNVNGIRTTSSMDGNSVCVYGRSSNTRSCSHTVTAVGVTVIDDDGFTIGNLAQTDDITTIGGDSGGGWSFGNTAWGVHHGVSSDSSLFTPVQETQSALSVTILTK